MNVKKHMFVGGISVLYFLLLWWCSPTLEESVLILSLALVGLVFWNYRPVVALLLSLLVMALVGASVALRAGTLVELAEVFNLGAVITVFVLGVTTCLLRCSKDRLLSLRASLEDEIEARTASLDTLAQTLIEQDEHERVRMGQDLHDGVGQYLTGMLLHNEALREKLVEAGRLKEAEMVAVTTKMIRRNMKYISQLARTLFPVNIDEIGIEQALHELTAYFTETTDAQFVVEIKCDCSRFSTKFSINLHRIIHEAVQNALQYGRADRISILLSERGSELVLEIKQNGERLPEKVVSGVTNKLMYYRAKSINGTLLLDDEQHDLTFKCPLSE